MFQIEVESYQGDIWINFLLILLRINALKS